MYICRKINEMSENNKGKKPKPVYKWGLDGSLIEPFKDCWDAAESIGVTYASMANYAGKNQIKDGVMWSRVADSDVAIRIIDRKMTTKRGPKPKGVIFSAPLEQKVYMYKMVPVHVATFDSVDDAIGITGVSEHSILQSDASGLIVKDKYTFKLGTK